MSVDRQTRLRRSIGICFVVALLCVDIYATGQLGGSERTLAVVRSIVLPGLPFLEWHLAIGLLTVGITLASIGAWLRWGVDWLPALVMIAAVAIAAFVMPLHHTHPGGPHSHSKYEHDLEREHGHDLGHEHDRDSRLDHEHGGVHESALPLALRSSSSEADTARWIAASHEFTVVLVVFAFLARLRLLFDRLPGAAWMRSWFPEALVFPAVTVARAAALALLAGITQGSPIDALRQPELMARATRVNRWARMRFHGDPLRAAHAPLRAALALAGMLDDAQVKDLRSESRASLAGVPVSEPTWVRPLDGMLAACALAALGETVCVERWRDTFSTRFALRHGRRPAALHLPSMLCIGAAPTWEHAAATAIAYRMGWVGVDDWAPLRPRCLGRAASGARDPDTLRLIAAGKLWAQILNDTEALQIFGRRTLADDRTAAMLEALAERVGKERRPMAGSRSE